MLQNDLNSLYAWAEKNNKAFNGDKFEGMSLPSGLDDQRTYTTPENVDIKMKGLIKDLGVYVSSNCQFSEHIKIYVKETQKIAAWTLRTFLCRERKVLKVLLKMLIVPKIEYASIIWCPFDRAHINMIESIQRRYTSNFREYQTWNEEQRGSFAQQTTGTG